jgi:hypothetical protein
MTAVGVVLGACGRGPLTAVSWLDWKLCARMLLKHPALTIIAALRWRRPSRLGWSASKSPANCCTNEGSWNP